MSKAPLTVTCPNCKQSFRWDQHPKSRPFCSERCRLIDLGDWLEEKNRIPDRTSATPFLPPDKDLN